MTEFHRHRPVEQNDRDVGLVQQANLLVELFPIDEVDIAGVQQDCTRLEGFWVGFEKAGQVD